MAKYCTECGKDLASTSKFCQICGHPASGDTSNAIDPKYQKQYKTSENVVRKKMSPLTRNIVFAAIFLFLASVAITNSIGSEEREKCQAVGVILGPINEGPPNAQEFEKTWLVLDALANETSSPEMKEMLKNYTEAGRNFSNELRASNGKVQDAIARYSSESEKFLDYCEAFF